MLTFSAFTATLGAAGGCGCDVNFFIACARSNILSYEEVEEKSC